MLSNHFGRVLPLLILPLVLAGCSGSSSTGASAPAATATASSSAATGSGSTAGPTPSAAATTSATGSQTADDGCAPNTATIPKGAGKASSPDLDHDGKRDTVWLADSGTTRRLGVKTASGATFSTTFSSAAPQAATAIGQRLGDGSEIILLNTGRSVQLYAVVDCRIVVSKNAQGKQYSFDLGFTGYGTGVRCVDAGRGLQVAGMLADPGANSTFTVYQTRIALSDSGREARNTARQTLAKEAAANSSVVKSAETVSCGSKNPGANEPKN
jgi:hypothetical protein